MIYVANDIGSKELIDYFSPYDVEVQRTELDYADFVFYGNGIDGPCSVGIERKTIGFYTTEDGSARYGTDLISSIRSGRLSGHQLPGLFGHGDEPGFDYVIFLLEGVWRPGPGGEVMVPYRRGEWMPIKLSGGRPVLYRELMGYLNTLDLVCGGHVVRTSNPAETAAWLVGLYKWFQKPFEEHQSHQQIYTNEVGPRYRGRRGSFSTPAVGPVEMVAAQLPGVNKKAYAFGDRFESVREMVNAEEGVFADVEGIGKKGAKTIWEWFRKKSGRRKR